MKVKQIRQRETKTLKFTVATRSDQPAATSFSVDLPRTFADGEPIAAHVPTEVRVETTPHGVTIWLDVLMVAPC